MNWWIIRDITLFVGGMAGVTHETLIANAERPSLLILFAAMMGLPAFLQGPGNKAREANATKEGKIRRHEKRNSHISDE